MMSGVGVGGGVIVGVAEGVGVGFLRRRCLLRRGRRSSSAGHFDFLAGLTGLKERGRLVPAIGSVCKHSMRARRQPTRADRVKKAGADRAGRVRGAGSQDATAAALVSQRDQHQAAHWPALAGNLYVDAGRA